MKMNVPKAPWSSSSAPFQGGVEPPQSKALRAFSFKLASPRLIGIYGEKDS